RANTGRLRLFLYGRVNQKNHPVAPEAQLPKTTLNANHCCLRFKASPQQSSSSTSYDSSRTIHTQKNRFLPTDLRPDLVACFVKINDKARPWEHDKFLRGPHTNRPRRIERIITAALTRKSN